MAWACLLLLVDTKGPGGRSRKLRAMDNHSVSPRIKGNISKAVAKSKLTQGYLEDSNHTHVMCYLKK